MAPQNNFRDKGHKEVFHEKPIKPFFSAGRPRALEVHIPKQSQRNVLRAIYNLINISIYGSDQVITRLNAY